MTHAVDVRSMGIPAMLESLLERVSIGNVVEDAFNAHEIRRSKPRAAVYRHGAARTGTSIETVAHVAPPSCDVRATWAAGMQGVWVGRIGESWEPCVPDPDLRIDSFHALVDVLDE